ncbi:hypothetical protein GPECTOR_9g517 [Gonium pectorale]|uniref:Beta-carotene isomerase D27-like C-terminal domain-containing protein n=1 Tax=Gonium pectorale TaxID=33097 RepID=A0A150GRQ9_GONPE|nr:hypothetical protein GPECTOR_9g517 [Gonium pectorale]|eukprot:KXZ52473.1 hypothetical protein GPECTOR_9g517 [Gonium pectorale]
MKDPFAEKTVYNDNFLDKLFIKLYSKKMADQLQGVEVPEHPTYDDFVRISSEIMKGRNSVQQREVVREVLMSLLPPEAPPAFRKLFPPTQFSAEFNALIASLGFYWLVGESEVKEEDVVVGPNGEVRRQRSVVQIKKCRYLEASGCVGMCVNMCKIPTQDFFTNDFGLPLTMNPNFEDLSCSMVFGQAPPPMTADPAYAQPCFAVQCAIAAGRADGTAPPPCPKVDTERAKATA